MGGEPDAAGNSQRVLNLQKLNSDQSKSKLGFLLPISDKETAEIHIFFINEPLGSIV